MKKIQNFQADSMLNAVKHRGRLRRAISLLSAFVMLFTMNSLKFSADTLERIPMCGYEYDHVHGPECFDENGLLTCALHEHTDACYQERPVHVEATEVEAPVEEVEAELGGEAAPAPEEQPSEQSAVEEAPADEAPAENAFDLNGLSTVKLGEIIEAAKLPVSLADIEQVGMVDDAQREWVGITFADGDFDIAVQRDFDEAELGIVVGDEVYTVMLTNGAAATTEQQLADVWTTPGPEDAEAATVAEDEAEAVDDAGAEDVTEAEGDAETEAATALEGDAETEGEPETEENGEAVAEGEQQLAEAWTSPVPEEDEAAPEAEDDAEVENVTDAENNAEEVTDTENDTEVENVTDAENDAEEVIDTENNAETENVTEENAEAVTEDEQPAEAEEVVETEQPAETEENAEIEQPAEAEEVAETEQPAEAEEVAETEQPAEAEEVAEDEQPAEAEENAETEQPAEAEEVAETEQPAEAEENTEDEQPAEAEENTGDERPAAVEFHAGERENRINDCTVLLSWGAEAEIPDDVQVEIREIELGSDEYEALYADALERLPEADADSTQVMRFFDITLYTENDDIKEKVEPKAAVSVEVRVDEVVESDVTAIHYGEEETTLVDATAEGQTVTFEADSFSIYGVAYSKDAERRSMSTRVQVDLTAVDQMDAATVTGDTVTLSLSELLAGADADVTVRGELGVDGETFVADAEVTTASDVTVEDGAITLDAEALARGSVTLEMKTREVDEEHTTTVVTHTATIELADYPGRTDEVSGEGVTVAPVNSEQTTLPGNTTASAEAVAVPEGIIDEAENAVVDAVTFDITLTDGKGEAIPEPGLMEVTVTPANVNIYDKLPEGAVPGQVSYTLFHSHDGQEPVELPIDPEDVIVDAEGNITEFKFQTSSFSEFTLKYTVDFHWEVDGLEFVYSIEGGSAIALSELVKILGIVEEDSVPEFIASIEDVTFSTPELLWVGKAEEDTTVGAIKAANDLQIEYSDALSEEQIAAIDAMAIGAQDWALISLRAFDTQETLTVTMKNGGAFTIAVTDAQIKKTYLAESGETYAIIVDYDDDAQIPSNAELQVEEILEGTDAYEEYLAKSANELGVENSEVDFARFFDITILADGEAIQPKAPVKLTIELAEELTEDVQAVHFVNDTEKAENAEAVVMEATLADSAILNSAVSMSTEGFSVYGVVKAPTPASANDLDGYSVKISNQGYYLGSENTTVGESRRLSKTNVEADAPVWTFEAAGSDGQYYISTTTSEGKQYINISRSSDNPDRRGDITLSDNPQALTVSKPDGNYRIGGTDGGKTYYINQFGSTGGTGFAGWFSRDVDEAKLDFSFVTPLANTGANYMVVVKQGDRYYVVLNDGVLSPVEYNPDDNTVVVDDPMMWTYDGQRLYHVTKEAGFTGDDIASDNYYRYIDPNQTSGLSEDDETNTTSTQDDDGLNVHITERNLWNVVTFNYTNGHKLQSASNPNHYIGVENGKLKGQVSSGEAVEVFLADPIVKNSDWKHHAVNHIDISIAGSAEVDVPLAYGQYYDENGELVKSVELNTFEKVHLTAAQVVKEDGQNEDPLAITPADMKRSRITATCNGEPIDNAFYITGFNGNAQHTGGSGQEEDPGYVTSPQIRIDGSFLVAKMPANHAEIAPELYDSDEQYRKAIRDEHLANQVEYSVTVVKPVAYWLQIPVEDGDGNTVYQQLYDSQNNPIKVKADLSFSDSFTYWDSDNECPVFTDTNRWYYYKNWDGDVTGWAEDDWPSGDVARCGFSGMDFKLGGDESQPTAPVYCIEIIKIVVDEEGNRINSDDISDARFNIYRKPVDTAALVEVGSKTYHDVVVPADDTVKDLNVGSYTEAPDYEGYNLLRDKSAQIGSEGLGVVHDYNVTPALYYVKEDPSSIDDKITDNEGTLWNYKDTYILTEYAWRNNPDKDGSAHYSDTFTKSSTGDDAYCSSPELLGNHYGYNGTSGPYTNDFLEFYVYNVYREIETVDVPVDKSWPELDNSYTWSATFALEELEVLEDGTANPAANTSVWRKVEGVDPITISNDTAEADRTFSNLPKYRYYANEDGTFSKYRIMYSVDETAYELKQDGTTVSKWDNKKGLTVGDVIYAPQWPHDAGDLDDEMEMESTDPLFYHVIVKNYKSEQNVTDKLGKLTLRKTWAENVLSNAGVNEKDAYATFQLKRIKTQQHLSYDQQYYDGSDATVTLIGQDGNTDTLTVKKGSKVKIVAMVSQAVRYVIQDTDTGYDLSYYNGGFGKAESGAITVTGDMTLCSGNTWHNGKVSEDHLELVVGVGSEPAEDPDYTNVMHTYTLNRAGGWQEVIENLPLRAESPVLDGEQTISTYQYYFVEIDSNPSGIYAEMTDGAGNPLGDMAHPVNESNKIVVATNKEIPPFAVEKEWYSTEDPDNYPEVRFTLYQAKIENGQLREGAVFVDSNGNRYDNIPLGVGNNWHWDCPVYLPPQDEDGNPVGYYVQENSSGNNSGHVLLYQNSSFDAQGNVVEYGDMIDQGTGEKYDVKPLDYYNDQNDHHAKTQDQNFPEGRNGGVLGNTGNLTILNRVPKYMQMDIKKKVLQLQSDGSVATIMDEPALQQDIVLEIQLKRRVIFEGVLDGYDRVANTSLVNGEVVETGYQNAVYLTDWQDYGNPFMIGFDHDHNPIDNNDEQNNFVLVKQGGFFWRIVLNTNEADQYGYAQNVGLPAYGYYTLESGEVVPVRYRYIPYEIAIWSDMDRHPYKLGYEWFIGLQPAAWDAAGGQPYTFNPMLPNHDQDRIKNIQASNLHVQKDWAYTPSNVSEVYVKIYRSRGMNGDVTDVTRDIAQRTSSFSNYGFISDPNRLTTDVLNGALVLKPGDGDIEIHGMPLVFDSDNYNTSPYMYWIEEVGYRDTDGNVYVNETGTQSATGSFFPVYDQSDATGQWEEDWKADPTAKKLKLLTTDLNWLRVKNYPLKQIEVEKKWVDSDGTELTAPWTTITSVSFKVKRSDGKYLTFGTGNTLTIQTDGQRAVVRTATQDSTAYTVTYVPDSTDKANIGNWTTLVHGLQKYASDGTEYTYTVEELKDQNGKPLDGSGNVIQNCHTSVTGSETDGYVITNEKVDTSLAIEKTFGGEVELTDEQKQKITFTVTGEFDGTTETTKTFTYSVDGELVGSGYQNTEDYKWKDGVLVIKGISAGEYTVTETNDDIETIFAGVNDGKTYTHTRTYQVNAADPTTGNSATAAVSEGERTTVTITNTYDEVKPGNLKITKTTDPTTSTEAFDFTIQFSGEGLDEVKDKTFVAEGNVTSVAVSSDGKATVSLKNSEYVLIKGLPAGVTYTVTEGDKVGWTNTVKTNETGAIEADQTKEAGFTNVYSETTATPQGVKTLTGRDWNSDSFSFKLTPTGATLTAIADGKVKLPASAAAITPYAMNGTATKESGSGSVTFNFGDITFLEAGTYTFEMVETAGSTTGITYATNTVTVTVTVPAKNAVTGVFDDEPTVSYSNSDTTTGVENNEFVNTYDTSTTAQIKGTKAMNPTTESKAGYSFTLAGVDGAPVSNTTNGTTATSDASGSFEFGAITYTMAMVKADNTAVGGVYTKTYSYTVTENLPNGETPTEAEKAAKVAIRDHVKYDIEPKEVTVEVTYNEHTGAMNATVSPDKAQLKFTNEKLGALKLRKVFVLNQTGSGPETEATTELVNSLKNGDFTFIVKGPDPSTDTVATVVIKVENGVATRYKLNDADWTTLSATDKYVTIPDLAQGDYVITETVKPEDPASSVSAITGGKPGTAEIQDRTVRAHVTAGGTIGEQATVSYTNQRWIDWEYGTIDLVKTDETDDHPIGDATFELRESADSDTPIKEYSIGETRVTISTEEDKIKPYLPTGDDKPNNKVTLYLVETAAPDGYKLSTVTYPVEITREKSVTGDTTKVKYSISIAELEKKPDAASQLAQAIPNTPVGKITVTKQVKEGTTDSNILNGKTIKIGLFMGNTEPGPDAVPDSTKDLTITNNTGSVTFDELELGTYWVYELDAQNHPIKNGGTVTLNGNIFVVEEATTPVELAAAGDNKPVAITNKLSQADISIVKVDSEDDTKKLTGAKFKILRRDLDSAADVVYTVFDNVSAGFAKDDSQQNTGIATVDGDGKITLSGLLPGEYEVSEEEAPEGYIITQKIFYFTVKADGTVDYTDSNLITYNASEFLVRNQKGARLPSTGGMGTGLIYATGTGLLLLAVIAWVMKAKKRDYGAY